MASNLTNRSFSKLSLELMTQPQFTRCLLNPAVRNLAACAMTQLNWTRFFKYSKVAQVTTFVLPLGQLSRLA